MAPHTSVFEFWWNLHDEPNFEKTKWKEVKNVIEKEFNEKVSYDNDRNKNLIEDEDTVTEKLKLWKVKCIEVMKKKDYELEKSMVVEYPPKV